MSIRADIETYINIINLFYVMGRKKTGKIINCKICNKERYVTLGRLNRGIGIYCSADCQRIGEIPWNKGLTKETDKRLMSVSNKSREQMYREYANGTRDKNKIVQKAHETVIKKSQERFKNNPNIQLSKRGYMVIYIPQQGWKNYHHYIWEKAGAIIPKGYNLHHIDGDKLNNKLENLKLLTISEHHKLHTPKRNSKGQFLKNSKVYIHK